MSRNTPTSLQVPRLLLRITPDYQGSFRNLENAQYALSSASGCSNVRIVQLPFGFQPIEFWGPYRATTLLPQRVSQICDFLFANIILCCEIVVSFFFTGDYPCRRQYRRHGCKSPEWDFPESREVDRGRFRRAKLPGQDFTLPRFGRRDSKIVSAFLRMITRFISVSEIAARHRFNM
jgi:hypothetical protein